MIPANVGQSPLPLKAPSRSRFLIVAFLVPCALAALVLWLRAEYQGSERIRTDAARSFDRRINQVTLLSRIKDAETAQRGFLLTGNPVFLEPYEPARRETLRQIQAEIGAHDPQVSPEYLMRVRNLVARKFVELDRSIALYRSGNEDGARAMVAAGQGRRLMDQLRQVIGEMIDNEARRSEGQRAAFVAYRSWLQRVVYAVVSSLTLVLFAFLLVLWRLRLQRHQTLVSALEAAKRHAAILDSTIDAILILNPSGTVETLNSAATRMLGYTADELERRDISVILDLAPGDGSFHQRIGLKDGRLSRPFLAERKVRHRDGHEVEADVAMGVMSVPSGDHLVVSLRDIAERRRAERIKDDLISTVSHELRTPLTSIVGSLGLLRAGAAGSVPDAAARLVEIAENNSRRLIRLINDMLDIDGIESGKLAINRVLLDLRVVVNEACVGSEGLARANDVTLACASPDGPVYIDGDKDRLVQVVTNLLSNAVRAAPSGSTVDMWLTVANGRALLAVDDRGPGVPAAFRARIFGRFERVEGDPTMGTGLGLAISREIITRHDGSIWFEDGADGGTRFAFSLPLTTAALPSPAAVVLVCEENDDIAAELAGIAAAEGCDHCRVRSGGEALAALAHGDFGAMLVGLTLPDGSGLTLAHALRDGDPPFEGPILVIAASPVDDSARPPTLDVVDWIGTPADPERLGQALRHAIGRGRTRRPVILHLDDDRDLLDVVAVALEPAARIVPATDLASARAFLRNTAPDAAILDVRLASGSGLDLIPLLVGADGLAIPTIIYSGEDVSVEEAEAVDAVLIKARGSIPELKATIRRVLRTQDDSR